MNARLSNAVALIAKLEAPPRPDGKTLRGDTEAAVEFLFRRPGYPTLSASWVNPATGVKGKFETKSFPSRDKKELHDWVDARQGLANIYFALNPLLRPIDKKAERTDVESVASLHVDLDPRQGESQDEAFARIKAWLEKCHPRPSLVIANGGGLQAIWNLEEPIPIGGMLGAAEDAKLYNIALERALGGDNCFNVDRVLRLPGTVNIPDIVKRNKTPPRQPAVAHVLWEEDTKYQLSEFEKAAPGATIASSPEGRRGPRIVLPAKLERVADVSIDRRLANVPDRIKDIIINGHRPDEAVTNPNKDMSRSGWLFDAVCGLVRAKVDNATIAAIITDPTWKVSACVLDKGDVQREVKRVIERAHTKIAEEADPTGIRYPDGIHPKTARPYPTYGNTRAAIRGLGVDCKFDVFRDRASIHGHAIEEFSGEITDHVTTMVQDVLYDRCQFYPPAELVLNTIIAEARKHSFDPVCDYLDELVWDRVPRLDRVLIDYLGADDTPLNRAIGRRMFIALVRRPRKPGCKFDHMPVFSGKGGIGKSLFCRDLAGADDLYSDSKLLGLHLDEQQQQQKMRGKWVNELGELAGFRKAADEEAKSFITRQYDRARPAYGRMQVDLPRRGILVGTTNDETFLTDPSGNRRYWPVAVTKYEREAFLRDRDQILAEAAYYEAQSEALYLPDELLAAATAAQAERLVRDDWDDILADVVGGVYDDGQGGKEERVCAQFLLEHELGLRPSERTSATGRRLSASMRRLGWDGPKRMRFPGKAAPVQGYWRKAREEEVERAVQEAKDGAAWERGALDAGRAQGRLV